ncbi:MAG: tail fiber domain-containing protein, partial [Candidatus Margulisiibacteriota bacterium]
GYYNFAASDANILGYTFDKKLAVTGDITSTASISATSIAGKHYGDGSSLTGVIATSATTAETAGSAGYATTAGSATTATSATTAETAGSAGYATTAGSATTATSATTAETAGSAGYATTAGSATTATSATTAETAGSAGYATTAGNATQLNGQSASYYAPTSALATFETTSHASTTYVPYTGASAALNLGSNNLVTTGIVSAGVNSTVGTSNSYWTFGEIDLTGLGIGYIPTLRPTSSVLPNYGIINAGGLLLIAPTGRTSSIFVLGISDDALQSALEFTPSTDTLWIDSSLQIYDTDDTSRITNFTIGENDITTNPSFKFYGFNTTLDSANYVTQQLDASGYYNFAASDANILGYTFDKKLAVTGDITSTASISAISIAGKHYGDGSSLTGVIATSATTAETAGSAGYATTAGNANQLNGQSASYYATDASLGTFETAVHSQANYLALDQTTPQTVTNGSPKFDTGLTSGTVTDYWILTTETFTVNMGPDVDITAPALIPSVNAIFGRKVGMVLGSLAMFNQDSEQQVTVTLGHYDSSAKSMSAVDLKYDYESTTLKMSQNLSLYSDDDEVYRDFTAKDITSTGSISAASIAGTHYGDGSHLTGVFNDAALSTFETTAAMNAVLSTFETASHASTTYIPYTGASKDIDLGSVRLTTTGTINASSLIVSQEALLRTNTATPLRTEEWAVDLSFFVPGLNVSIPVLNGTGYSSMPEVMPFPYGLGIYDKLAIVDKSGTDNPQIMFAKTDFSNSATLVADMANGAFVFNWPLVPDETGSEYSLGASDIRWANLYLSGTVNATSMSEGSGTAVGIDVDGNLIKNTSSLRYKKDVSSLEVDSTKIYDLKPVSFTWKKQGTRDFGLIAEDVNKVIPQLVVLDRDNQPESVKYDRISVLMLLEMKKLKQENEELKRQIEEIKSLLKLQKD